MNIHYRQLDDIHVQGPKLEVPIEPVTPGDGRVAPTLLLISSYTTLKNGRRVTVLANLRDSHVWMKRNWRTGVAPRVETCTVRECDAMVVDDAQGEVGGPFDMQLPKDLGLNMNLQHIPEDIQERLLCLLH